MRIAITGAGGLIGSPLTTHLADEGHDVIQLRRARADSPAGAHAESTDTATWDPMGGSIDREALEGLDAFVHLAGEPIAGGRWTTAKKKRIHESRARGTELVATALSQCARPPATLVCASAVGYYGDRGDTLLDETSPPGEGFLADVCRAWESAADLARETGIRVVHVRFGPVLARNGGALAEMLTPFRLGVGGVVGSGRQFMSWIALDDAVGAVLHALDDTSLEGPLNVVAPEPVRNRAFTRALGETLGRPTVVPLPAFAARLAFGQLADELLLASTRVDAGRLTRHGYTFRFPNLRATLADLLS